MATSAGGGDHSARIVALGILHFLRHGGGIVPTHVVPHGHQDRGGERRLGAGVAPLHRRMERQSTPNSEHDENGERRKKQHKEANGSVPDRGRAAQIPYTAEHDNRQ